jgi:hypothetical protein
MEATGLFCIPIYELLEQHGISPYLVNAGHVKTVPGRKTDWNDAHWLQKLQTLGLLQASFRPDAQICTLRSLVRYRAELIERRAPHINHLIQALKHMNIQLNRVLTDITGLTGLALARAIIAGEPDPQRLAHFRQSGCKHSEAESVKAVTGTWDDAQFFVLQQAVALFDYYTTKITECDTKLEQQYQAMEARCEKDAPLPDLPPAKPDSKSKNALRFNARAERARDWCRLGGGDGRISREGPNDYQRDWQRYGALPDGQTFLLVAWPSAPQRYFGRQSPSVTDDESAQAGQPGVSPGGAVAGQIGFVVWCILPRDAGTPWPQASDCGNRAQDCANGIPSVEDRRSVSGRKRRRV